MGYRLRVIGIALLMSAVAFAHNDSLYLGTQVKLDIASPSVIPAANSWKIQHYEVAVNVRLAKRFYPTLELGYAGGSKERGDTISYRGRGGFFRIGADINPLKKHPESPHALLVGVRIGTAVQDMEQTYSGKANGKIQGVQADCWGEIVAGCQVEIAKVNNTSFYMGWMGRFKFLFTRTMYRSLEQQLDQEKVLTHLASPIYIPGFGPRDNIGWGLNYYLGWRF